MDGEFLDLLQKHTAETFISASAARSMGPAGTVAAARQFLARLDLSRFSVSTKEAFEAVLYRVTRSFVKKLPHGAQHWGSARKFLNIFLRASVYNRYLSEAYSLGQIEPWLEVPLDSHVARGLRREEGGRRLPRWKTVKGLDARTSRLYQQFALEIAEKMEIDRVHLDLLYWRRAE